MKRSYLIVPGLLLVAFGLYHQYDDVGRQKIEKDRAAKLSAAKLADAEKKAKVKTEIDERNQQLTEQRAKEARDRVEKKRRDFESTLAQLAAETATHATEVEKLQGEATATTRHLAELRAAMEKLERTNCELAKWVEARRIERHNADLEIQRAVRIVAARLDTLALASGSGTVPAPLTPRTR